jgi:ectoine hydroxylase-related dioxygenase (phytanoyl-CoA dioxygenase family)
MPEIEKIDRNTPADQAMEILERDGAVIYENLLDAVVMDQIEAEFKDYLARASNGEGEFWGFKTKRFGALVAKSPTFAEQCAANPTLLAVMDLLLLPRCDRYHLHVTMMTHIGPNETPQILHRDDGLLPFTHPGPQAICNTMWAMTDFTRENGATSVILGSHDWDDERMPQDSDEISQAVMAKGSCLLYVGSVWHGGSANTTRDEWRSGLISGYSLGWLRQEENMYLAVPPAVAKDLPEHVQHLIGYKIHGQFLGWVEGQDPHIVLEDHYSDVMPATSEGGELTEDENSFIKTATLGEPRRVKVGG